MQRGLSDARREDLLTNIGLLDEMASFDAELVQHGQQTPVYFGSALTNFGVQLFLDDFIKYAPAPGAYQSDVGPIEPTEPDFSGFVFKIQANMNPRHRDSVAFVRVCSGRFERNMSVYHARSERLLRLSRPYKFFAEDREVVDEAYPGDIIGLPGSRDFSIGDTINAGSTPFNFAAIPTFPAEHFARLINVDVSKQKQFIKGLSQLQTEGAMQILYEADAMRRDPILAVVGMLQFDVVEARLEEEYGVVTRRQMLPQSICRWIAGPETEIEQLPWRYGLMRTHDAVGRLVGLFNSEHELAHYQGKFPQIQFRLTPEA